MLHRLARFLFRRRRSDRTEELSIWVITCNEMQCPAIVEVARSGRTTQVLDCSAWAVNPFCGRNCTASLAATESDRPLSRQAD